MSHRLYALYCFTEQIKHWFVGRFTKIGRFFLLLFSIALLFGINIERTMIYQIAGIVFSMLFLAFVVTLRFCTDLKVTRIIPETCVSGREIKYIIQIENKSGKPIKSICYRENAAEPLPTHEEFSKAKEEGEEKRNKFDRKMGYYRWLWLLQRNRRIESYDHTLPEIGPMKNRELEISLLPVQRGNLHLKGYILTKIDPLGLCKHELKIQDRHNLLVLPKLYPVPNLFFPGSRKYHQGGLLAAQNRGDSSEFLSLRDYSHGDPIKHIDWKSTARLGKTMVRQYREEYFSRFGLILDSFSTQAYSRAFEEAVSVAASIMMSLDGRNSFLDLFFVGNECITCSVGNGLAEQRRMLEILASVATCRDKSFAEMTSLVKGHASLLSGIVLILIDLDEERNDLIKFLLGNRIPVQILVIVDNKKEYADKKKKVKVEAYLREIDSNFVEEELALL